MIVEIFEQKHRSEHKKECPRINKFYRCLLLHLFLNGACKCIIKHALNDFGHKITKKNSTYFSTTYLFFAILNIVNTETIQ